MDYVLDFVNIYLTIYVPGIFKYIIALLGMYIYISANFWLTKTTLSLSLSLSLYIYIHIYICTHTHTYIYIYIYVYI